MKTKLFLLLLYLPIVIQAQQVTLEEAQTAATSALLGEYNGTELKSLPSEKISVEKINQYSVQDTTFLYEVVFNNGEGVLLSGNKNCLPVLGYLGNTKMSLFDKDAPCCLTAFLEDYVEQIRASFIEQNENADNIEKWNSLLSGEINNAPPYIVVEPLTTSTWGQSSSNDYYALYDGDLITVLQVGGDCEAYNYCVTDKNCSNSHCDTQNRSKKPVAGCVAIAMAQIMYYWKYPMQFDWCNMVDSLVTVHTANCRWENRPGEHGGYGTYWVCDSTPNINYEKERNAVAHLIERCGNAVDMDYGCDSSSSTTQKAAAALRSYGYNNAIYLLWPQAWVWRVKNNLDNGHPLCVGIWGDKTGGHEIVCDGYMSNNYFHFNWGWKGLYDNHWFTLDNIYDSKGNNYWKLYMDAIFDIYPTNPLDYCNNNITVPGGGFPLLKNIIPNAYLTILTIGGDNGTFATINSGENLSYKAHQAIYFEPNFQAKVGSQFRAYIEPCESCTHPQPRQPQLERDIDIQPGILIPGTPVSHAPSVQPEEDETGMNLVTPKIFVYPNPTTGIVNIVCENTEIKAVSVFDVLGRALQNNISFSGDILDLSYLSNGIYFVKIKTSSDQTTHKIIIEK